MTVGLEEAQRLRGLVTTSPTTSAVADTAPRATRRSTLRSLGPRNAGTLAAARPRRRPRRSKARKRRIDWVPWLRLAAEITALLSAALVGVIVALAHLEEWFGGEGLWSHLVAFAGAVLALCIASGLSLWAWVSARRWLARRVLWLPALLCVVLATAAGWFAIQPAFHRNVDSLRTLVGGPAEAERVAIAHQVYASYRRSDLAQMRRVLERGRVYEAAVHDAASAFDIEPEVLMGIGVVESSFNPRNSKDGGRGLFQITAPPAAALADARKELGTDSLDMLNQRHNAFVAAATLRRYLDEMKDDPFLGLLAYNIGPRNGGLLSIMRQYGARDFVTIQPYLQNLPRDYPIRVLSAALAYRLWRSGGALPRYEEGRNARGIQAVGIPGLQTAVPSIGRDAAH
jgi:soluble lytic murein transglycosylase-like protein